MISGINFSLLLFLSAFLSSRPEKWHFFFSKSLHLCLCEPLRIFFLCLFFSPFLSPPPPPLPRSLGSLRELRQRPRVRLRHRQVLRQPVPQGLQRRPGKLLSLRIRGNGKHVGNCCVCGCVSIILFHFFFSFPVGDLPGLHDAAQERRVELRRRPPRLPLRRHLRRVQGARNRPRIRDLKFEKKNFPSGKKYGESHGLFPSGKKNSRPYISHIGTAV